MEATEKAKLLKELGLEKVAEKILKKKEGKEKLLKAVEYKYATQTEIDDYCKELNKYGKRLVLTPIKEYKNLPPDDVLSDLKIAQDKKCFDEFLIAHVEKVKDPILFGRIKDFPFLYFYIGQWGDDVKIEDIIGTV